jgi:hypothetical protein
MVVSFFPVQIRCVCPLSIVECQPLKQKEFNLSHSPPSYFLVDDYSFSLLNELIIWMEPLPLSYILIGLSLCLAVSF